MTQVLWLLWVTRLWIFNIKLTSTENKKSDVGITDCEKRLKRKHVLVLGGCWKDGTRRSWRWVIKLTGLFLSKPAAVVAKETVYQTESCFSLVQFTWFIALLYWVQAVVFTNHPIQVSDRGVQVIWPGNQKSVTSSCTLKYFCW